VELRKVALRSLSVLGGAAAASHAPSIKELFQDTDEDVRKAALECLGKLGDGASSAAEAVSGSLQDGGEHVHKAVPTRLTQSGGAATPLLPAAE